MPFIHRYICANQIECPLADIKMRKFWNKETRNMEAKYTFASYFHCKYNIDDKYFWWW